MNNKIKKTIAFILALIAIIKGLYEVFKLYFIYKGRKELEKETFELNERHKELQKQLLDPNLSEEEREKIYKEQNKILEDLFEKI